MRDYTQPPDSHDDDLGHDGQDVGGQMPEAETPSPEQIHAQAQERYQQAKSGLVETKDGRHWLSKLRWDSTETSGHVMVHVNASTISEEANRASREFIKTKTDLAESFNNLPTEDKAKMRPDVRIGATETDTPFGIAINLERLAEVADAHHTLAHFRHHIRQSGNHWWVGTDEKVVPEDNDYSEMGRAWATQEYLGEAQNDIECYVMTPNHDNDDDHARRVQVATALNQAHRRAVDVGDQDVEVGMHELRGKLSGGSGEWDRLLDWEA